MRRLVALLGKNQEGPWICTAALPNPALSVEGLEGTLVLEQGDRPGVPLTRQEIPSGKTAIPTAKYSRLSRSCTSVILCLITSG